MDGFTDLIKNNKALFWDIAESDYDSLDDEAVVERFMAYGDMQDIRELKEILSGKRLWKTFDRIRNKTRVNLNPKTINFFNLYLSKYAS